MKIFLISTTISIFLIISINSLKIKRQIIFPDDSDESPNEIDNRYPSRPFRPFPPGTPFRPTRLTRPTRVTTSSSSTVGTSTQRTYPRSVQGNILFSLNFCTFLNQNFHLECVDGCILRTTGEFNPVCGTDMQQYHNENRMNCAIDCGYRKLITEKKLVHLKQVDD